MASNTFKVLVQVDDIYEYEYEDIQEAFEAEGEGALLERAHRRISYFLKSYLGTQVDYIGEDGVYSDSIAGIADSEALLKEVSEWNDEIFGSLERCLSSLQNAGIEVFGEPRPLYDTIMYFENGGELDGFDYGIPKYHLRHAVNAISDIIDYGSYHIFMPYEYDTYQPMVKIPKKYLEDIKEHPESYAIIYVDYK